MKLNELQPKDGSTKNRKRVGRGIGSGKGKTCGVGQKGQKSRSGVAIKGFEGGQMPIYRRLPKFGFSNVAFQTNYVTVNVSQIQTAIDAKKLDDKKEINAEALKKAGVISSIKDGVKILGSGELKAKITLNVAKISKGAQEIVEKAGGSVTVAPIAEKIEGKLPAKNKDARPARLAKKNAGKKPAKSAAKKA